MRIEWIYKLIPVPVVRAPWAVPDRFDALSLGLFVLHNGNMTDGLLAHELVHCRQCWRTGWLHPILYRVSKRYRARAEIEGYAEQVRLYPGRAPYYAECLATKYGLDLPAADFEARLVQHAHQNS